MASSTETVAEVVTAASQLNQDMVTRLLNGSLHASYPPIERFMTIDGLLRSHASQSDQADIPLICYPVLGAADFEKHTAGDLDRFTDAVVQYYMRCGLVPADPELEEAPVIGVLVGSSFEVILTMFALNRLGYAVLFLSTRLTAPAYSRLLALASCRTLIVAEQYEQVVREIREECPDCVSFPVLKRQDWFAHHPSSAPFVRSNVNPSREGRKIAWILHSSGSTGHPKPIFLSNLQTLANWRKSFGLRFFTTSPLFHSFALMELGRALYTRATAFFGNHALPTTFQNLHDALEVVQPEQFSAVPYVIKLLAERPEGVGALAKPKIVLFGGSSCPDDLGDRLVAQGVNLVANYGATETGQIMTSFRPAGIFECVALAGLPSKGPSNSKPPYSENNPANSFRTADLFTRHPDPKKKNFYKYLSRLDDRITLVNGEKVLPLPIEGRIREEPLVRECVVFGYQRTVPGALVFRSAEHGRNLSNDEFLEAIWPAVEAANSRAETFSRIPKELVIVMGESVKYAATDKGTFIRAQVYQQFSGEIEAAYASYGEIDRKGGLALDPPALEDWLLTRFRVDLGIPLADADADIFAAGVDSLQTTQVWRFIVRDLDLGENANTLSQNIVFEKGTVHALAKHLHHMRVGQDTVGDDEIQIMRDMIQKYSHFRHHHPTISRQPEEQVVLVTGATGNLGAFILGEMLKRSDVSEVWALVRAPGPAVAGVRLYQAMADRKIHLTDAQASKLRAVPSDLSQANLGLESHVLEHLLSSLTCIVHSAWAVNFNLGVRSFEQQHIHGTHNLINFCLRSKLPLPARFFFCSSVSTASNAPKPALIRETVIKDLHFAQATGYGCSKLVTELITHNAMRQTGLQARVLRIGQLSGDTVHAQWNDTEAVALMFRSVLSTGALPELGESPAWLPVDQCAKAVTELAMKSEAFDPDAELVYNLVNPQTFSWKNDLLPVLATGTKLPPFEIVSPEDWLRRLESSEQDPEKNPSIKLVDFWRGKYGEREASSASISLPQTQATLQFETCRTVRDCPSLGLVKDPVTDHLVQRYIEVWMQRWMK
ncbi:NRPS-like protein biosynthetic cluster [Penicillium ucsense]|uniref:NRPS-like protein biosynthetic cluster n=1 Tax=Penicillium ucsense TaxID=2839758 RepID=A0A8J8W187_9EURO|nr:NRPS-like protein biosynthetic cluster [Penicillium ucsense]KAF7735750.1 NRPS-like protein biosynthetic cluster [Penicillium ucsense]